MNVATKHRISKLFAVALAFLMMAVLLAGSLPAYAAPGITSPEFYKHLVFNANAQVPPVTFTYTVTAGQPVDATASSPAIYAGIGSPTISQVEFTADDTTGAASGTPTNSTDSTMKYATKTATVSFSGINFTKPGIYRYVIAETSNNSNVAADSSRILDVYVQYPNEAGTGALEIVYYVFHTATTENPDTVAKTASFTSQVDTNALTLKKVVTGNQGDRDKNFTFTVTITGAANGTVFATSDSAKTMTVENGTATGTFELKHNGEVSIYGLVSGMTYTITEDSYAEDGYTTTNSVVADSNTTGAQTMGDAATTVTFFNHKQGTVPTGIIMEVAPFALLAVIVGAAFVLLVATRKHRSR